MGDGPIRGGTRGGRDQFKWDDVKNMSYKDREQYLGQSVLIGYMGKQGKWRKDDFFTRSKEEAEQNARVSKNELDEVKRVEEQMMREALGLAPKRNKYVDKPVDQETLRELTRRIDDHDENEATRITGVGYTPKILEPPSVSNPYGAKRALDIFGADMTTEGDSTTIRFGHDANAANTTQQPAGQETAQQQGTGVSSSTTGMGAESVEGSKQEEESKDKQKNKHKKEKKAKKDKKSKKDKKEKKDKKAKKEKKEKKEKKHKKHDSPILSATDKIRVESDRNRTTPRDANMDVDVNSKRNRVTDRDRNGDREGERRRSLSARQATSRSRSRSRSLDRNRKRTRDSRSESRSESRSRSRSGDREKERDSKRQARSRSRSRSSVDRDRNSNRKRESRSRSRSVDRDRQRRTRSRSDSRDRYRDRRSNDDRYGGRYERDNGYRGSRR